MLSGSLPVIKPVPIGAPTLLIGSYRYRRSHGPAYCFCKVCPQPCPIEHLEILHGLKGWRGSRDA